MSQLNSNNGLMIRNLKLWLRVEFYTLCASLGLMLINFGPRIWGADVIGNDYPYLVYEAVIYRFYTNMGIEPLWYPHVSGGAPFSGLSGAQIYHLPAWLLSLMPGYWTGNPLTLFIAKTAFIFWIGHLAFYFFLNKEFQMPRWPAFLISALVIYNLRSLDSARFASYLDSWIYFSIFLIFLYRVLIHGRGTIFLVVSLYLFISSGYSPMVIYGFTGALLLTVILLYKNANHLNLLKAVGASLLGLTISSPVIALTIEAAKTNHARIASPNLEWSNQSAMTYKNLLAGLFSPWVADVQSGFGGSSALSVLLLVFFAQGFFYRKFRIWIFSAIGACFFLYAFGEAGGLFTLFYKFIPAFQWIRVPGRFLNVGLTMITIFCGMIWIKYKNDPQFLIKLRRCSSIVLSINLVILIYVLFNHSIFADGENQPQNLRPIWQNGLALVWIGAGLAFTAAASYFLHSKKFRRLSLTTIVVTTALQMTSTIWFGTWYFPKNELPSKSALTDFQRAYHLPLLTSQPLIAEKDLAEGTWGLASLEYFNFLNTLKKNADCVLPIYRSVPWTIPLPFYFTDSWICDFRQNELSRYRCTAEMMGKVIVEEKSQCISNPNRADLTVLNKNNRLTKLGPGSVELEGEIDRESVFVTPYPFSKDTWRVTINDQPASPIRISGGLVGVIAQPGKNKIHIAYHSQLFEYSKLLMIVGIIVLIIAIYLAWLPKNTKYLIAVALLVISIKFWPLFEQEDGQVLLHNGYSEQLNYFLGP